MACTVPIASRLCRAGSLLNTQGLALPTETKVESGTSQSKSGTSFNVSNSGYPGCRIGVAAFEVLAMEQWPTLSPIDRPELSLQQTPAHKFTSLLEVDSNP